MRHPISIWKCAILLLIIVMMVSPLASQSLLTGTVTDAENARAVSGTTIFINGQKNRTNSQGKFSFDLSEVFEQIPRQVQILVLKESYEPLIQQVSVYQQDGELQVANPLEIRPSPTKNFVGAMFDDSTGQIVSGVQAVMKNSTGTQVFEGSMDQLLTIPVNSKMGQSEELTLELSHPLYHTQMINILPDLDGYGLGVLPMRQSFRQAPGEVRVQVEASVEKLDVAIDGLEADDQTIRLRLYHKGNPIDMVEIENGGYIGTQDYVWPLSQETKWKGKGYQIHAENLNTLSESFSIGKSSKTLLPVLIGAGAAVVGGVVYLLLNRKLPAFPHTIPE